MEAVALKLLAAASPERAALIVLIAALFIAAAAVRSLWARVGELEAELNLDHRLHVELLDRLLKPHRNLEAENVANQNLALEPPGEKRPEKHRPRRARGGAGKSRPDSGDGGRVS